MQYRITVNDDSHFELSDNDVNNSDITNTTSGKFHLLSENKSYESEVVGMDFRSRKYIVKINNVNYTVSIQNDLDLLIKEMGFETGANKLVDAIKAPMPGLILEISVSVGQQIVKGDPMIILGAMKMENSFVSPRDGIIKALHVNVNDAVDKGQLLIEFE